MKNIIPPIFVIVVLGLIGKACQKPTEFDKQAMLESIVNTYVLPSYDQLEQDCIAMETACSQFLATPNNTNLVAVQNAWKTTMITWSSVEMLNFGPGRDNYRYLRMDNTPTNTNSIENAIQATTPIDSAYVAGRSSYTKGIASIEYLLFGAGTASQNLDWYSTGLNKERRGAYLLGCIKNLKKLSQELIAEWGTDGSNYGVTLSQTTNNSTAGGIGQFCNAIIHISQTIARKKLGKPLGKEAADQLIHPELRESLYADFSWEIIQNNLKGIKAVFGDAQQGLGSYLTFVQGNADNANAIHAKISALENLMNARTLSLKDDLTANTAEIEVIYTQTKALYDALLNDMSSYFSITILANPDDGD